MYYINIKENPHLISELMQLSETDKLHAIAEKYGLNKKQKRAYIPFSNHRRLTDFLSRSDGMGNSDILPPPQMLLSVSGEGGTGKSRVIEAVCAYFEAIGRRSSLIVCAPTGNAAVNIGGSTIHSSASIVPTILAKGNATSVMV